MFFVRTRGEKTLGEVVKVNPLKYKVKQLEARGGHPVGTLWSIPPSLLTPAGDATPTVPAPVARRPEAVILKDIQSVYLRLEPENLTCDGELPPSRVLARSRALRQELSQLFRELGRDVSETEAFALPT